MGRLSEYLDGSLKPIPGIDMGMVRKAQRVQRVRDIWAGLVDQTFLDHTNNVFIFEKDGRREMHVYVDESIYAAELNNQRELITWRCREEYGEEISCFHIHISRGKHKSHHPFYAKDESLIDQNPSEPLSEEEKNRVDIVCEPISDSHLKACFKKAMISDLEWKKGNRQ